MLNQLTDYLLQHRHVTIPNVGTIRLVQQPPQADGAARVLRPPQFLAEIAGNETVTDHQLTYLSATLQQDRETVLQRLAATGTHVSRQLAGEGFRWNGIGWLRKGRESEPLTVTALDDVPAEKIQRAGAEHNVLVGDQQMTSTQMAGRRDEIGAQAGRRSPYIIAAWILLFLSILFILFILYQGKFRLGITGSKVAPTGYLLPAAGAMPAGA